MSAPESPRAAHWNAAWRARAAEAVTWADPGAAETWGLVAPRLAPGQPVIDVGGGASDLAGRLLAAGLGPVDVLDVSEAALAQARARLGARAGEVGWITADITRWRPARAYALWHDRAVFHFLTEPGDRAAYAAALGAALAPGGHAVIATFAEDGPERCSGLPVQRYSPAELAATLEALLPGRLAPVAHRRIAHRTPSGGAQRFQATVFRMKEAPAP